MNLPEFFVSFRTAYVAELDFDAFLVVPDEVAAWLAEEGVVAANIVAHKSEMIDSAKDLVVRILRGTVVDVEGDHRPAHRGWYEAFYKRVWMLAYKMVEPQGIEP